MTASVHHLQIQFRDFGDLALIPMAFPAETAPEEIMTAARTLLEQAKAQEVRVVNTAQPSVPPLWWGKWEMRTGTSGGTSMS